MTTDVMKMPSLAPGADLDAYLRTISQFPILTPEDEQFFGSPAEKQRRSRRRSGTRYVPSALRCASRAFV